jgi:hypothetical protein
MINAGGSQARGASATGRTLRSRRVRCGQARPRDRHRLAASSRIQRALSAGFFSGQLRPDRRPRAGTPRPGRQAPGGPLRSFHSCNSPPAFLRRAEHAGLFPGLLQRGAGQRAPLHRPALGQDPAACAAAGDQQHLAPRPRPSRRHRAAACMNSGRRKTGSISAEPRAGCSPSAAAFRVFSAGPSSIIHRSGSTAPRSALTGPRASLRSAAPLAAQGGPRGTPRFGATALRDQLGQPLARDLAVAGLAAGLLDRSTSAPSSVQRRPASRFSRVLTGAVRDGLRSASNRSSTAVDTLFTFCPPGPEARVKLSVSSQSCRAIVSVMRQHGPKGPGIRKGRPGWAALTSFRRWGRLGPWPNRRWHPRVAVRTRRP